MIRAALSRSALVGLLAVLSGAAWGQGAVLQGGPWAPGHAPMYVGQGSSQAIVQDSGPAGGGAVGLGLSEQLLVARGTGTAPYAGQGTGPYGTNWCDYDASVTNPAGYHFLCLSANAQGGGLLAYGAGGAAAQLPISHKINGSTYSLPFVVGGIVGPSTTVVGDLVVWNNTTGTVVKDMPLTPYTVACNPTGSAGPVQACGGPVISGLTKLMSATTDTIPSQAATVNPPRTLQILSGSAANPITTYSTPSVKIVRQESITAVTDGSDGPALMVVTTGTGSQQPVSIVGAAYTLAGATSDVVGIYGIAQQNGAGGFVPGVATGSAFGGFFNASATTATTGAVGAEIATINATGVDRPYSPSLTPPYMWGIDVFYASLAGNVGGPGVLLRAGNSTTDQWDVGVAFSPGSIRTADLYTTTGATNILYAPGGSHVNGVNLSGATFSGVAFSSPGWSVSGAGTISQTSAPTSAATLNTSNSLVSVGTGGCTAIALVNGLVVVRDNSVTGDTAVYLMAKGTGQLVSSVGTIWVAPTASPGAGHASVAVSGGSVSICNTTGVSVQFAVGQWTN